MCLLCLPGGVARPLPRPGLCLCVHLGADSACPLRMDRSALRAQDLFWRQRLVRHTSDDHPRHHARAFHKSPGRTRLPGQNESNVFSWQNWIGCESVAAAGGGHRLAPSRYPCSAPSETESRRRRECGGTVMDPGQQIVAWCVLRIQACCSTMCTLVPGIERRGKARARSDRRIHEIGFGRKSPGI